MAELHKYAIHSKFTEVKAWAEAISQVKAPTAVPVFIQSHNPVAENHSQKLVIFISTSAFF